MRLHAKQSGDTIVEVLIAIAIAAFAIGTAYSLAHNSVQRAITARERNEALSIAESQITALKFRYKQTYFSDPARFNSQFAAAPSVSGPASGQPPNVGFYFCLDKNATGPTDPNWDPKINNNITQPSDEDDFTKYNAACVIPGTSNGVSYYVSIAAEVTSTSKNSSNRTVYRVAVRWPTVGSNQNSTVFLYYRF